MKSVFERITKWILEADDEEFKLVIESCSRDDLYHMLIYAEDHNYRIPKIINREAPFRNIERLEVVTNDPKKD